MVGRSRRERGVAADSYTPSTLTPEGRRQLKRQARVLGLVTISSPMAMNMYVPAFPEMAASLGTDLTSVQLTITSYLAALAIGQNVYGPLSDRYGRKSSLYAGLALFVVASVAVALSRTLPTMVVWRFVQGFGACAALAIPRAMMRDQYTGPDAARMLAGILLIASVAPILAPLAGSLITLAFGWPAIFWVIAAAGLAGLLLVRFALPETLPRERRSSAGGFVRAYSRLLRDPVFMSAALMMAFGQAVFLGYLAASPAVFMGVYGLESWQFSLIYAVGAISWGAAAQAAPRLMERYGAERVATLFIRIAFLFTAALYALAFAGFGGLWALIVLVCLTFAALGIMLPTATVAALHPHGEVAGSASALIGTLGFALGAAVTAILSAFADGTVLPMLAAMVSCALLAELLGWIAFRRPVKI